ncbi:sialidase family protein [Roseimicrobium sp. ORNL1]|uniref:sialidase family protein n=1 Tax=Roseimicrobium sp. ORNL1 TaxID=2711231 RepID=UPI00197F4109|nr:sialidase family protein [Roseimicrobium sp. ORNL1]
MLPISIRSCFPALIALFLGASAVRGQENPASLLPPGWNPKEAGDRVMQGLVNTTAPRVKGAHDAGMVLARDRAWIVAEANDVQPGEAAKWPYVYVTLSIVNLKTQEVENVIDFARGEQVFENETLPVGACFVPRIIQKDKKTLRCYFASESPGERQSQMWYTDFDMDRMCFTNRIHKVKLKTASGTHDMQPQYFYEDAVAQGFKHPAKDFGLYIFDNFKTIGGKTYVTLNNYPICQNALALVHPSLDTFEVLGHFHEPTDLKLSESAAHQLPGGTWLAICRQEGGTRNYTFATSMDGRKWTENEERSFVTNGASSKPTLDKFGDVYYLGWQEGTRIDGVSRSVFNVEVSKDGKQWERKYRFETTKSFQYPVFAEYNGSIYVAVTQGDSSNERKERIMFGKLE